MGSFQADSSADMSSRTVSGQQLEHLPSKYLRLPAENPNPSHSATSSSLAQFIHWLADLKSSVSPSVEPFVNSVWSSCEYAVGQGLRWRQEGGAWRTVVLIAVGTQDTVQGLLPVVVAQPQAASGVEWSSLRGCAHLQYDP